jgi:hypothetical protein
VNANVPPPRRTARKMVVRVFVIEKYSCKIRPLSSETPEVL